MGIQGLVKPLLVLAFLFSAGVAGAIDLTDPDEGWKDTATDIETARLFLEDLYPCKASAKNALGCVKFINGLGAVTKPKQAFLPTGQEPAGLEYKVLVPGKYIQFVEVIKPAPVSESLIEISKETKRSEDALRDAVAAMTAAGQTVPFLQLAMHMTKERDESANISAERMIGEAINQLILVHDGHGGIGSRAFEVAKMESANKEFFGVGLQLQLQKTLQQPVVIMPIQGGVAEAAGVLPKDVIVKVNGAQTKGKTLDAVVGEIRGEVGKPVTLEFIRDGVVIEKTMIRKLVQDKNVKSQVLEDMGAKVAYIKAGQFDAKVCGDVKTALADTTSVPGVQAVILDLRDDPGGLLDESVCMGGVFAGPKVIVGRREVKNGETIENLEQLTSTEDMRTRLPLIVMINERSASASEIVSGALQDHRRAVILGTRSYGKATIQSVGPWKLQEDLNIRQTVGRFYQPTDRTNQIVGIQPDIEVFRKPNPTVEDKFAMREAESVPSALKPVGAEWTQPRPEKIAALSPCFQQRAEKQYTDDIQDFQLLKAQELAVCPAFKALNDEVLAEDQKVKTAEKK